MAEDGTLCFDVLGVPGTSEFAACFDGARVVEALVVCAVQPRTGKLFSFPEGTPQGWQLCDEVAPRCATAGQP
jgi:hypothetical protein